MKKVVKNIFIMSFIAGFIFLSCIFFTLPDISDYMYEPTDKSSVMSRDGKWIGDITTKNNTYIQRSEIPDMLVFAVVSVEDKRFFKHFGVDIFGIGRAFYINIREGEIVEGASTITQQTATLLFFNKEKSYIRKIKEVLTAFKLEAKYTKDEIITIYLNEIYFGAGAYGIYEASQAYFSKKPADLKIEECAMLAGIIQAPSAYSPINEEGFKYATQRKEKVLGLMFEQGYITEDEYNKAMSAEVKIKPNMRGVFSNGICGTGYEAYMDKVYTQSVQMLSEHYMRNMSISKAAAEKKAQEALISGEAAVTATLSQAAQQSALSSLTSTLSGKSSLADSAFVFLNSDNGDVLVYYGSSTYIDMVYKPRQPGSTIKPLFMAYLIENGYADKNTVVNDERFDANGYSPPNVSNKYMGYVTMRETLVNSLNAASLRFFLLADQSNIIDFVKTLGISTISREDYNAAFALGGLTNGIMPMELAQAYAAINNGGVLYQPNFVYSIKLETGEVIYPKKGESKRVMSSDTAEQLRSCLESTVIRGTAKSADPGYLTHGKTGTTDNERDVWFAGSTGNMTAAIWMGNVDAKPVKGISSSWCRSVYKAAAKTAAERGAVSRNSLKSTRSESVEVIAVRGDEEKPCYEEEDIIKITVPLFEKEHFAERIVTAAEVDAESNKLFNQNVCPEHSRTVRYFTAENMPREKCWNILHHF